MFWGSQLLFLFLLMLLLMYFFKFKTKTIRLLSCAISSLILSVEVFSVFLTGAFVDYRFVDQASLKSLVIFGFQFKKEIVLFFVLLFLFICIYYGILYFSFFNKVVDRINKIYVFLVVISLFLFMSVPGGVINNLYNVVRMYSVGDSSFETALKALSIEPGDYTFKNNLTAESGKNIIVIQVESLEQGFLKNNFEKLTPELTELSKKWQFFDKMPVSPGGSWTCGALYSHQAGVPALFNEQGNFLFQEAASMRITSLADVLNKAGYNCEYLLGRPDFAGIKDFLRVLNMPVVSEKNCLGRYPKAKCGLNDLDLFREARLQLKKLRGKAKPFALFMLTINTHFPRGIYDKRMERFVSPNANTLLFSVSAVDYLIGNFIKYLKNEKLLDDTVVYIFPDHYLMGTGSVVEQLRRGKRQLYLLTNAKKRDLFKNVEDTIFQIDLPRLIIGGAGIKTNAKFLCDYLKGLNYNKFIRKNTPWLVRLNAAAFERKNYLNGFAVALDGNKVVLRSQGKNINFNVNKLRGKRCLDVTFSHGMVLLRSIITDISSAFVEQKDDRLYKRKHLIVTIEGGHGIDAYLGDKQLLGIVKKGLGCVGFSREEIKSITNIDSVKYKHSNGEKSKLDNVALVVSSSWRFERQYPSRFFIYNKNYKLSSGLNLLFFDEGNNCLVTHYDVSGDEKRVKPFIDKLSALIAKGKFFILASDGTIKTNYVIMQRFLSENGFSVLKKLNGRWAYVAYRDNWGRIHEFSSSKTLSYYLPVVLNRLSAESKSLASRNQKLLKSETKGRVSIAQYSRDRSRFIAHAGGKIDGRIYTDSLEALNNSYAKGFRLFELDIIKTSDGEFVAGHDWKHWWVKVTKYKGDLPPTKAVFLKYKIFGKYTPLDMDRINNWFKVHKDAILVTDKVNDPVAFSNQFVDKKRLMMELFTWESVKKGLGLGMKSAMPTGALLGKIKGDKVAYLKALGVRDIAVSHRIINSQKALVRRLANAGIHLYVFYLHFDKGKDEKYVVEKERQFFYGMYADDWNFN